MMEDIMLKAIFLFQLESKQEWINKVPRILPPKIRNNEQFLWIDTNGNVLEIGADFKAAEEMGTYPVKVYRTIPVRVAQKEGLTTHKGIKE